MNNLLSVSVSKSIKQHSFIHLYFMGLYYQIFFPMVIVLSELG